MTTTTAPSNDSPFGTQYGRCGSPERLKVLAYLSDKPEGATLKTLAELLGLTERATTQVVRGLRAASPDTDGHMRPGLLRMEHHNGTHRYYTRAARELHALRYGKPTQEATTC